MEMNDQFIIENLQYVFGVDALETSRPINIDVNTIDEIDTLFDAISYEKGKWRHQTPLCSEEIKIFKIIFVSGSSVIRMAANFLGEATFKKGLSNYLTIQ